MHITGVPYQTLMDIGRWRSLGFMVYIQQQISSFSRGVLVRMSAPSLGFGTSKQAVIP